MVFSCLFNAKKEVTPQDATDVNQLEAIQCRLDTARKSATAGGPKKKVVKKAGAGDPNKPPRKPKQTESDRVSDSEGDKSGEDNFPNIKKLILNADVDIEAEDEDEADLNIENISSTMPVSTSEVTVKSESIKVSKKEDEEDTRPPLPLILNPETDASAGDKMAQGYLMVHCHKCGSLSMGRILETSRKESDMIEKMSSLQQETL